MKHEILKVKGRIAELKNNISQKELEASGLIIQIRSLCDPYESDMTKIKAGNIRVASDLLDQCVTSIKFLSANLKLLEDDLG